MSFVIAEFLIFVFGMKSSKYIMVLSHLSQGVEQLDLFGDMSTPPDLHSPSVSLDLNRVIEANTL